MASFLSRLFGPSRPQHFIAIDIGSNTAIRSLVFGEEQGLRTVIEKKHFELPRRSREEDLIPLIGEYLPRLLFQYLRTLGRVPTEIAIGLGNHFTFNQVMMTRSVRERPHSPVEAAELETLLNAFLEAHRETRRDEEPHTLVHLMPFRIAVDGYPIARLSRATRGRVIEVALFATYADNRYWQELERLRSILGGLPLWFISNQAAVASALIAVLNVTDALIIKIGARITEVTLMADGAIRSTGQFPRGGDECTATIARRLAVGHADAERIKRQWGVTVIPARVAAAAEAAIAGAAEEWLDGLVALLKREERYLLPERVYLLGGGAKLTAIRDAMVRRPWFAELTFLEKLDVERLNAETIAAKSFRNLDPALRGPEEVALAALANCLGRPLSWPPASAATE